MIYILTFEGFTNTIGIGSRPELAGELVKDDENIIVPINVDITGHIGSPIRSVRVQKIGKSPKVKLKKAAPNI